MTTSFHDQVYLKYQVYNSLFLTLPFGSIYQTATLLPLLAMEAKSKLEQGSDPGKVINDFLEERFPHESEEVRASVLFDFIKYVERQVVLFDAIEDASFEFVHDMQGPGTITGLASRHKGNRDLRRARDFAVRIVMTAHPTQFYPGRVLSIISDLDLAIRTNEIANIGDILLQLGKTPMVQKVKPTPFVEARRLIWYLQNVFYSAIGDMLEDLGAALDIPVRDLPLETMVRMGFWPGGDRVRRINQNRITAAAVHAGQFNIGSAGGGIMGCNREFSVGKARGAFVFGLFRPVRSAFVVTQQDVKRAFHLMSHIISDRLGQYKHLAGWVDGNTRIDKD